MTNTAEMYGELRLRYRKHLARRRANNLIFWITVVIATIALTILGFTVAPRAAWADETQPAEQLTDETQTELHVESNILEVGEDGVILTGEDGVAKVRYDFTDSRFPAIEDPKCVDECRDPAIVSGIGKYIKQRNRNADGIQIATWLTEAKAAYGPDVPLEAAVATMWKESTFNAKARNRKTNCIGYFQWMHRYHAAPMRKIGLDIYDPQDNIIYFFMHVQRDLDRGKTLDQAMWPWEVWWKYGSRKEYHRLLRDGWPQ